MARAPNGLAGEPMFKSPKTTLFYLFFFLSQRILIVVLLIARTLPTAVVPLGRSFLKCLLDFSASLSGARGGGYALIPAVQSEARAAFLFPSEAGGGRGPGGCWVGGWLKRGGGGL